MKLIDNKLNIPIDLLTKELNSFVRARRKAMISYFNDDISNDRFSSILKSSTPKIRQLKKAIKLLQNAN